MSEYSRQDQKKQLKNDIAIFDETLTFSLFSNTVHNIYSS